MIVSSDASRVGSTPTSTPMAHMNIMSSRRVFGISILLTILVGSLTFSVTIWSTSGFLVWSDGLAYFLYARSAVLDHDTDISNEYDDLDARFPADTKLMIPLRDWTQRDAHTGQIRGAWPVGAGLVMTPFYALGYGVERLVSAATGRPPDSYGIIPQYFFCLGSLAFGLLGFWASVLTCSSITKDNQAAYLSASGILLAGPAVFYIFFNPSMAHASSFGLASLLTLQWWKQWHRQVTTWGIAILGMLLGILVTIRYQNILFGLLPLSLLLRQLPDSSISRFSKIAVAGSLSFALPITILILHSYYYGVHEDPGLGQESGIVIGSYPFDLRSPYFLQVLFSCRHGAFYWAPVLAIGATGLVWSARQNLWAWPLLLIVLSQTYLIGALGLSYSGELSGPIRETNWNDHWGGAPSFGMRYLTECGPVFAVGLAVLIHDTAKWIKPMVWYLILVTFVIWNGLLIIAYGFGTISRSYCISYEDMIKGIAEALQRILPWLF